MPSRSLPVCNSNRLLCINQQMESVENTCLSNSIKQKENSLRTSAAMKVAKLYG